MHDFFVKKNKNIRDFGNIPIALRLFSIKNRFENL